MRPLSQSSTSRRACLFCAALALSCGGSKTTSPADSALRLTLPVIHDAHVTISELDPTAEAQNDGRAYNIGVISKEDWSRRAYIALPVPDDTTYAPDRVTAATLVLTCKSNAPVRFVVRPVLSPWDEQTINGANAPNLDSALVTLTRRDFKVRIDVSSIYRDYNPAHGIAIETAQPDSLWFYFRSSDNPVVERRPVVYIAY